MESVLLEGLRAVGIRSWASRIHVLAEEGAGERLTMAQQWWDKSMNLPFGKTCNDCANFKGCLEFLGPKNVEGSTHCDWAPSRFRPVEAAVKPEGSQ